MAAKGSRKVIVVGQNPLFATGYARVVREISTGLANAGLDVLVLGHGYQGESHSLNYRVAAWPAVGETQTVVRITRDEVADVLLTVGDPWMFQDLPATLEREAFRTFKWLAYFPVDGQPLPESWKRWIAAVDLPVVFCQWTANLIEREMNVRPAVIRHGVDLSVFRPMDKASAKSRVGVPGAFVVGCVAANQQRKNLPALVKAFANFAQGKPDVILYLHTQIDGYWDIEELVRRFGVEPKTRATLNLDPQRGVDDHTLAIIYNAFDVFVLPTMAEGFGLPIIESQACGVPCLVTDYSACGELVPDPFCRLAVKDKLIMARNFEQAIVDETDIAAKLERLYRDRAEAERLGRIGREFVSPMGWEKVCAQFVSVVEAAGD
jgi:glycosyltransferase involved in cell wall biosynthesis